VLRKGWLLSGRHHRCHRDNRSFGDCCEEDGNCTSGVCHEFGQLGLVCTESCTDDSTCPEGADGTKKCNAQSVCRP